MNSELHDFRRQWSDAHGGVPAVGIVGGWLKISFYIARSLKRFKVSANQVTFLGVLLAAFVAISSPHWWSALILAFSLLCDGVDGSLAIISQKSGALGATYDAVADRLSEALWALAFYRLGAPVTWVIFFWTIASVQEYARARLSAEGIREVGVVTPSERPVRASFLCIAIIAWQIPYFHGRILTLIITECLLQAIGLSMVIAFAFKSLKKS